MMRPRTLNSKVPFLVNGVSPEEEREKEKASVLGLRKKGMGVRAWLLIDSNGGTQMVEAGKYAIMRRACLPARDLRILDPLLSYPSTILGRERAIVVNLEHIKAIITAQEVLLLNSKDPAVVPFVLDLQKRVPLHFNALGQQVAGDGVGGLSDDGETAQKPTVNSPADVLSRGQSSYVVNKSGQNFQDTDNAGSLTPPQYRGAAFRSEGASPAQTMGGPSVLPFEFRALEVCLEAACSSLDAEATTLEREAYPALDELTSKLSTLNLEQVRQIKSRLVAISGRVQKVRDEIEQLLDDDGDMAEMYLTDKLLRMQMEEGISQASSDRGFDPKTLKRDDITRSDTQEEASVKRDKAPSPAPSTLEDSFKADHEREIAMEEGSKRGGIEQVKRSSSSSSSSSSSTSSGNDQKQDVEELEMLLEAYFVQIDGTLNKLSTLREYVDDTEDYINIMLDDKQNSLLQMGVMLTTATLVVSAFIVLTGIFGMNIHIELFDTGGLKDFVGVVGGGSVGCAVMYVAAILWYKYKRLLE